MSVPTNLIPTTITGLQEYTGSSTLGYMPYILDGRTYKVQFANIAAVGAVPSTRVIAAGTGLAGGGDLSANRVISIAAGGVGFDQLALSGVVQGTYGSGSAVPVLTVDAKGRVTSATTAALDVTGFVPTSRTVTAGDGLTGGGSLASNVTLSANFSASTPSALGIASAGTAITVSRGDHVHPAVNLSDTTQTQGALPLGRGGTGDALSPVAGAVVYSTGTRFALTNPGLPGQFLVSNGTDEPQWQTVPGTGTVTSVAVATANGFAGFVANPNTVAVITLQTTVTGLLKGDGTGLSAATAGVDYVAPGAYTTSGLTMATARLLGRTTASVGAAQELTVGTGLTLASSSLVNAAPDQVVSLTGAGTTVVTGTYPNFTITSNDSSAGTVTSVAASGGTTGLSFTGSPITTSGTLTLGGTLAVANGGTGATSAASALTNLGAYPASNPSGFTSNVGTVTSVSGTGTVSGLSLSGTVTSTGSLTLGGTLAVLPSNFASQTANTVLAAPNGSAGVPTFRAIVAADVPTLNQNTTGTASNVTGIVAVANGGTGATIAGTARTNLGAAALGANTDITSIALTSGTITNAPTAGTDLVNKTYADSISAGINFHQSVNLASATTLAAYTYNNGSSGVGATITANANGALSVDGVAVASGNRILIKNEVSGNAPYNGVYTVTQTGSGAAPFILTRSTDYNTAGSGVNQINQGDFFLVTAGSTQANTSWVQQTALPITVGTTALTFTQFAAPIVYSAGTGLTLAGTVFSIANTGVGASTYGSASSVPVIAVNAQGQLTSASSSAIAIATSQVTSGTFTVGQGGTGATTLTGYVKGNGTSAFTASATIPAGDITGAALTKTDDTNVTLTLGGTPASALLAATSITAGWTGQLAVARGGTGASTLTANGVLLGNGTSAISATAVGTTGQVLVGNTGAAPTWATLSSSAVTSFSAGTTGFTPSTATTGAITLAGTLNVANGGTGATTLTSGYLLKGNGTSAVSASIVYDSGTNVGIGTASASAVLDVKSQINVTSPSNVSMNAVRASNFGYSTGYSALILGSTSGNNTPCINVDPIANASGAFGGLGNEVMFRNGAYFISPNSANTAYNQYLRLIDGYVQFTNSARAPIFYDSDNTAFYADMAGTSNFNQINLGDSTKSIRGGSSGQVILGIGGVNEAYVQVGGSYYSIWNSGNFTPGNYLPLTGGTLTGTLTIQNSNDAQLYLNGNGTSWAGISWADVAGSDFIWYNGANSTFAIGGGGSNVANKKLHINGGTTIGSGLAATASGTNSLLVEASITANQMYSQIFYDSQNGAYYVDPASGSNLNTLTLASGEVLGAAITFNNMNQVHGQQSDFNAITNFGVRYVQGSTNGPGISGATQYYGFSLGLGSDYAYSSFGSQFYWPRTPVGGNPYPSVRFRESSTWGSWSKIYAGWADAPSGATFAATGDFRAPIFYDSNDTTYYINPNASSAVKGAIVIGPNNSYTQFIRLGGEGQASDMATVCTTNGNLHADSKTGFHIYLNYAGNGNIYLNNGGGYTEGMTSIRAPIFYDSNNTGYYLDPAGTTLLNTFTCAGSITTSGSVTVGNGATASYIYMADSDEGTRIIHCNSNRVGFLSQAGGWGAWCDDDGSWRTDAAMYSPVYYDINNTGYYLDPASGSYLNAATFVGLITGASSASTNVNTANDTGSISIRGSTTTVATMSFHRTGAYAINMGLGTDNVFRIGGWSASSNCFQMDGSGNLTMLGNVTAYSDARLKKDVVTVANALDLVGKMRGVTYTRIDTGEDGVGVIAQEMLEVMPQVVQQGIGEDDTLSVAYGNLVGVLIEAIKELTARVAELEGK